MFINKISESKGNTFKECRLKYRYKYVDRLPELDSGDGAMEFGSYIHKIFEDGVEMTTLPELLSLAESLRSTYKFASKYEPKIEICCKNFLDFNSKLTTSLGTETKFSLPLNEDVEFNGVIDRIIGGKEQGILVIDYKTSKREKTKAELYMDSQLKGYTHAAHILFKVPYNNITVAHYYPITNNFVPVQYSASQINAWVRATQNLFWKIRKTKKEECMPCRNQYCNWCSFKGICPEFNSPSVIQKRIDELKNKS